MARQRRKPNVSIILPDPTLADVENAIRADTKMWKQRREEVANGLLDLARLMGQPMAEIPARPDLLRKYITNSGVVIAARDADRIKCTLRAALERLGLAAAPGRYGAPLSRRWVTLVAKLPNDQARIRLARLCRFASALGLAPVDVNEAFLEKFLEALKSDGLIRNISNHYRATCTTWNDAVRTIPTWPRVLLNVPNYGRRYRAAWSIFPASLKLEFDEYLAELASPTLTSRIERSPLRPQSIQAVAHSIQSYISALVQAGCNPNTLTTLETIVKPSYLRLALEFLLARLGGKVSKQFVNFAQAIAFMARHWVKVEGSQQKELDTLHQRVSKKRPGLSARNAKLLQQFESPSNVRAVLRLPQAVMALKAMRSTGSKATARIAQTAIAIEILIVAPIRFSELLDLDLTNSFVRPQGPHTKMIVNRYGYLSKVKLEIPIPDATMKLIRLYLSKHRQSLICQHSDMLFPGKDGASKCANTFRIQIQMLILERTGLTMTPDLFRHFAAKHYLNAFPGDYKTVQAVVGHKSVVTTIEQYSYLDAPAAMRLFDSSVQERLLKVAPKKAAPPKQDASPFGEFSNGSRMFSCCRRPAQ